MITRFRCLPDAAIFASRLREEGYFAEVIHVNAGHLFGPTPDWGIAVLHSDLETGDEAPPAESRTGRFLKLAVLAVPVICGIVVVAGYATMFVEASLERYGRGPRVAVIAVLTALIIALVVRALRASPSIEDEDSPDTGLRWLPASANRAVILAIAAVVTAALGVFLLLGLLATMASAPVYALMVLIGIVLLAGTVALGHLTIRAFRNPGTKLHLVIVILCQILAWFLVLAVF